jgi:hypothetical protein
LFSAVTTASAATLTSNLPRDVSVVAAASTRYVGVARSAART